LNHAVNSVGLSNSDNSPFREAIKISQFLPRAFFPGPLDTALPSVSFQSFVNAEVKSEIANFPVAISFREQKKKKKKKEEKKKNSPPCRSLSDTRVNASDALPCLSRN